MGLSIWCTNFPMMKIPDAIAAVDMEWSTSEKEVCSGK